MGATVTQIATNVSGNFVLDLVTGGYPYFYIYTNKIGSSSFQAVLLSFSTNQPAFHVGDIGALNSSELSWVEVGTSYSAYSTDGMHVTKMFTINSPSAVTFSEHALANLGAKDILVVDNSGAMSVWVTDGTAAGSSLLANVVSPVFGYEETGNIAVVNGTDFFETQTNGFVSIWETDGTSGGTRKLWSYSPNSAGSVSVYDSGIAGNKAVFAIGDHGLQHVYSIDRSGNVENIFNQNFNDTLTGSLEVVGGVGGRALILSRQNDNFSLFSSDGTKNNTIKIFNTGATSVNLETTINSHEVFLVNKGGDYGFWTSDGTANGTHQLFDYNASWASVSSASLVGVSGNQATFAINVNGTFHNYLTDGVSYWHLK